MEFEPIIGLELHIEMKTKSKMFSSAPVTFGREPNSQVSAFDLAMPGTMPLPNKQVIIHAIRVAHALHMEIDNLIVFDRKNYFYSDLPKGYQITQELRPLGKNGYLDISKTKRIGIERLHIEEDTCKQVHYNDFSLLDYNRAGIPLIEIVTKPDITNGQEAARFVEEIRSIVTFLDVSDGKMEEGSLRCDVNVSLKEKGSNGFGTKVEIKNLNSFVNIEKAINYEIARQKALIETHGKIKQETRRFDEKSKQTVVMRVKLDAIDYKPFIEPNIIPIKLSDNFIKDAIDTSLESASEKQQRYIDYGLSEREAGIIVSSKEFSEYYDDLIKYGANPKLAANWMLGEVKNYLNKKNIDIKAFELQPHHLAALLISISSQEISNKQGREIFIKMVKTGEEPNKLIAEIKNQIISDEAKLLEIINKVLDDNSALINDYKSGKDRVLKFFIGQVIKLAGGEVNPKQISELLKQEIDRR